MSHRRVLFLAIPLLVAGCASSSPISAGSPAAGSLAGAPPSSLPPQTAQPSCAKEAWFDERGGIHWAGATYVGGDHSTLTDADRGQKVSLGCEGRSAYAVAALPAGCQLMVFDGDGYNIYAAQPHTAGCPTPAPQPASTKQTTATPPSPGDCPSVPKQQPGRAVIEDFVDVIHAGGVDFLADNPPRVTVSPDDVGQVQFTVRCSYSALNAITRQETPGLRDHDATFLPAGTPVYALKGQSPSCRLAAHSGDHWRAYLALASKACASASPTPSTPSTLPSPTRTSSAVSTGAFGTCPSPSPTESGSQMAVDYVDVLQANGRSYMSDYGMGHAQGSQRGAPQMTIGCTLSAWSDRYGQATMESHDGWATFLPIGTVVYAVKGHSPLCQHGNAELPVGGVHQHRGRLPVAPTARLTPTQDLIRRTVKS